MIATDDVGPDGVDARDLRTSSDVQAAGPDLADAGLGDAWIGADSPSDVQVVAGDDAADDGTSEDTGPSTGSDAGDGLEEDVVAEAGAPDLGLCTPGDDCAPPEDAAADEAGDAEDALGLVDLDNTVFLRQIPLFIMQNNLLLPIPCSTAALPL